MRSPGSLGKRLVAAGVVCAFLFGHAPFLGRDAAAQMMVTLRQGREIEVQMIDDARSGSVSEGDEVRFRVVEDVEVHGQIALSEDAEGVLVVGAVKKNGMLWGKPGRVDFPEGWITIGAEKVPVTVKGRTTFKGKSKKLTAILLTPLLIGLFLKGGPGGIEEGERILIEVAETRQIPAAG